MFQINREIQALSKWEDLKFNMRKSFGCFAPGINDGNKCKNVICGSCCSETLEEFQYKLREKDLYKELMVEAPLYENLSTHDGVIYFPKELLPEDQDYIAESVRAGGGSIKSFRGGNSIHDIVPPFILKSKQLNLKLKIKNSQTSKRKS